MVKVAVIFYSTYGHIYQMAKKIKEGLDSIDGVEGVLYQVPETLPQEVLEKMHAPPKPDVPVITAAELPEFDGLVFGVPTRFGAPAAQIKSFLDSTGGLWQTGALAGKPAGMFVSTGTQGGGQESTFIGMMSNFVHHGMIYVPTGYTFGAKLYDMENVRGGSPWGPGTYAGPTGARQPSEDELESAVHYGARIGSVAYKVKMGPVRQNGTEAQVKAVAAAVAPSQPPVTTQSTATTPAVTTSVPATTATAQAAAHVASKPAQPTQPAVTAAAAATGAAGNGATKPVQQPQHAAAAAKEEKSWCCTC